MYILVSAYDPHTTFSFPFYLAMLSLLPKRKEQSEIPGRAEGSDLGKEMRNRKRSEEAE